MENIKVNLPVKVKLKHLLVVFVLLLVGVSYLYREPILGFVQEKFTALEIRTVQKVITEEEEAVISVVEKASPAVVSVVQSKMVVSPFSGPTAQEQGIGTGFIIRGDGVIVTNRHVVSDEEGEYSVVTKSGEEYKVENVVRDTAYDMAILKIDAQNLPTLSLGDSDKLQVGQTVVAIGNALGRFSNTVTRGVVSGIGRGITASGSSGTQTLEDVIQTDAAINPGNSGGPLLNLSGEVIAVNVAVAQTAENIGFAIPVNVLKPAISQFEETGDIVRPFLGIRYVLITEDEAKLRDLTRGAFVQGVVEGSAAEKAGVKPEDVIVAVDGRDITESHTLAEAIVSHEVGDTITLKIDRGGEEIELEAKLGKTP